MCLKQIESMQLAQVPLNEEFSQEKEKGKELEKNPLIFLQVKPPEQWFGQMENFSSLCSICSVDKKKDFDH